MAKSDEGVDQKRTKNDPKSRSNGKRALTPSSEHLQKVNADMRPNITLNRANRTGTPTEDQQLLRKPQMTEPSDFTRSDTWRVLRIMGEFVSGFDTLAEVGGAVTVFGSARTNRDDPMYAQAVELGKKLAEKGFAIITGGGPGIMEAANKGCKEAGGMSIGCNIELPFEQGTNAYVDVAVNFRYFFVRKMMFVKYSEGFVIFPGGFGTMDELFEALTLIQTGKVENFPLILFGTQYWGGLLEWIKQTMVPAGKISAEDLNLLVATDSVDHACELILNCYENRCWETQQSSEAVKIQAELGAGEHFDLHPTNGKVHGKDHGGKTEAKNAKDGKKSKAASKRALQRSPARPEKDDAE